MASRYYAPSGPQGAAEAIQQLLLQRAIDERQAQLDAEARQERLAAAKRDEDRIGLERTRITQADKDRDEQRKFNEAQREFQKASTIATVGLPGRSDEDTAGLMERQGFGTLIKRTPGSNLHGYDEAGLATEVPLPGVVDFLGGSQYQARVAAEQARVAAAKEAERARDEQQAATAAAAAERAREANETRLTIAGIAASGRNANADLQRQILEDKIETTAEKKATAQKTADAQRGAVADKAQTVMDIIGQLAEIDPKDFKTITKLRPGTEALYGIPILGRTPEAFQIGETADARAAMNQLMEQAVTDFLGELKAQSRTGATGFGALSQEELRLVQNASSQLRNPKISSERVRTELERILKVAKKHYDNAVASPARTAPGAAPANPADPLGIL
jgi:hypothetical protein